MALYFNNTSYFFCCRFLKQYFKRLQCIIGESGPLSPNEDTDEGGDNACCYAAKELRDEKVAFFATRLPAGRHEFTYLLRAQIPGDYHVMPTIANLMYYTEYQGNGNEARVRIVE